MCPVKSRSDVGETDLSREILRRVREVEIRTLRNVEELLAGTYHSAFRGRGVELHEVREYYDSDDVRDIDWNVTARFGRPFVKTYVEERELTVIIVADVSPSMSFGTGRKTKRQACAEATALLALSAVENDDRAGMVLAGPGGPGYIPPRKRRPHALRLVREVLAGETGGPRSGLKQALEMVLGIEKRRSIVIVLSDFHEDPSEWFIPARLVARRHDLVFGFIYDRREAEPPSTGVLELLDSETGARLVLDPSSAAVAEAWSESFCRHRDSLYETALRIGADVMQLDSSVDLSDAVAAFFRRRSRRRR
ncbi:MAG: DUF58 domain-containing protein [Planctomycetes bacterium]|nr:DUF58 domain-containing protein [Planctomycetota bacterium]